MVKSSTLKILYKYVTYSTEIGRSPTTDFQRKCFPKKRRKTIANQIRQYENRIFFGPRLLVLGDVTVKMVPFEGMPALETLEKDKRDNSVYHSMALVGSYSLISFRRNQESSDGTNILTYAESIVPTYPSSNSMVDINLSTCKAQKLPTMRKSLEWDDLDWGIYHNMRDPNRPSNVAAKALGLSHMTVLNRFYRIQRDCSIWMPFFPKGYNGYSQSIVQLKTEYEVGLRDELQKLDRSTYIYKIDDFLLLHLFLEENKDLNPFLDLEKKGLIHSLGVSIPLRYHNRFF
jgi:hypothetical protein